MLPIYQTGWFYLIILFLGASYWFISAGGLNVTNQANINMLNNISPLPATTSPNSLLTSSDILTLQSSFRERDVDNILLALSYNPDTQVTLLGNYTKAFIEQFEKKLANFNRPQKVIIASNKFFSGEVINVKSSMMFSEVINWFRFSPESHLTRRDSQYLLYAPVLLNQKQSTPILWHHDGDLYLSLVGEILKQMSNKNNLAFNEHWQLSLENKQNTTIAKKLPLGFFTDIYIAGSAYKFDEKQFNTVNSRYDFNELDDELLNTANVNTVSQYVNQTQNIYAKTSHQYKAMIIIDNSFSEGKIITPFLTKLSQGDYLYKNFSIYMISWIILGFGFFMLCLIVALPLKKQVITLMAYTVTLCFIQYFIYKQQQWLAVQNIMLFLTGTWLLLLAYQKEYNFFLSALKEHAKPSSIDTEEVSMIKANAKQPQETQNHTYKSPQNFNPSHNVKTQNSSKTLPVTSPLTATATSVKESLEQTIVITKNPDQEQTIIPSHISVKSFGRYQVEGILGKGAMGIVYQGVDPKINRHVAIKTLQLSDDIESEEFIEAKTRFFKEAQTAGGLSHANIVTIYDVGEENNLGYIAMDLLTGAPLSLFTQPDQTLPIPLVYQLMIQITDALAFAHNQNVVHRDIKPANIIYDDDLLKVTVTDFGIAYVSDNSKTRTGIIMGSPYYMSPEQILGSKVDGRSDIFSLGVTFYQLLCGYLPFEGESIATVAYQITKAKPQAVNQRNSKLPASALRITNKAMHKDIAKRYQSMAEFRLALLNALKRDFKISAS